MCCWLTTKQIRRPCYSWRTYANLGHANPRPCSVVPWTGHASPGENGQWALSPPCCQTRLTDVFGAAVGGAFASAWCNEVVPAILMFNVKVRISEKSSRKRTRQVHSSPLIIHRTVPEDKSKWFSFNTVTYYLWTVWRLSLFHCQSRHWNVIVKSQSCFLLQMYPFMSTCVSIHVHHPPKKHIKIS